MNPKKLRIIFMGTPDFAVESLKILVENNFNIVGVITSPDKPSGRGQKINISAVKKYALENELHILQPTNLKSVDFISELSDLKPDLQIVVAFRMLPKSVWALPPLGTFNLHASLLPNYRGAAPINWAIINGEETSGITTFLLDEKIDTGKIIHQKEIKIDYNDSAGTYHDKLMFEGAKLVLKTVESISNQNFESISQDEISDGKLVKHAPKIFKEDCKIDWKKEGQRIYNFIRGLSPYPAAWTIISSSDSAKEISLKIFEANFQQEAHQFTIGMIDSNNKNFIRVAVQDGFINLISIQLAGKKKANIKEFLNGFNSITSYKCFN